MRREGDAKNLAGPMAQSQARSCDETRAAGPCWGGRQAQTDTYINIRAQVITWFESQLMPEELSM